MDREYKSPYFTTLTHFSQVTNQCRCLSMSSHECDYCLKKFSRADSRKRHEKTCKVKEYLNPIGEQTEPTSPNRPDVISPVDPPSPTETTETGDLESPKVDCFGDPLSPDSPKPMDVFPESHTSPVKMDEVSDMDPWDEFRERVKTEKLKDFKVVMKTLRKEGLGKKLAKIRAYNQILPDLQKELRQVYIEHLKWVHVLREDPLHKAILETRNRLIDEDDMDFNEAVEAAVNQRKYLLNRVFQPIEEPDTDDEDMDEEEIDESPDEDEDDMVTDGEESPEEDEDEDESSDEESPENSSPKYSQGQMGYIPHPSSATLV